MKITIFVLLALITPVFGDLKDDADSYVRKAVQFLQQSEPLSAGPERNECFQRSRILFEKALELYYEYLEEHPKDSAALEPRLTEINSQIFWCNKLTTLAYDKSTAPTAEELAKEEGLPPPMQREKRHVEMEPYVPKIEEIEDIESEKPEPVLFVDRKERFTDGARIKKLLDKISYLVRKRRVVEAKIVCKRALADHGSGIPSDLVHQIMKELEYVNTFFSSVFDRAMELKGKNLVYAKTINNMTVKGVVSRFDKGVLYIDMEGPDDTTAEFGVPLFSMYDGFLVSNLSKRTKDVMVGMAAFFLLEGKTGNAKKIFAKVSSMKGAPEDISPFLERVDNIAKRLQAQKEAERATKLRQYLKNQMLYAIKNYTTTNYNSGLLNINRILEKSKRDLKYLIPISRLCFKNTRLYLPELTKDIIESCSRCHKKRSVTCSKCKGRGKVKPVLGRLVTCSLCKGSGLMKCPYCIKRMTSKRNLSLLKKLNKIFKRDDKPSDNKKGKKKPVPLEEKRIEDSI